MQAGAEQVDGALRKAITGASQANSCRLHSKRAPDSREFGQEKQKHRLPGGMAERFKAPVLKTGVGASPPWVRIPLPPPEFFTKYLKKADELARETDLPRKSPLNRMRVGPSKIIG